MLDLGSFDAEGYSYTGGSAINASGQVAGSSYDGDRETRALVWQNNGTPLLDLGTLGGEVWLRVLHQRVWPACGEQFSRAGVTDRFMVSSGGMTVRRSRIWAHWVGRGAPPLP